MYWGVKMEEDQLKSLWKVVIDVIDLDLGFDLGQLQ